MARSVVVSAGIIAALSGGGAAYGQCGSSVLWHDGGEPRAMHATATRLYTATGNLLTIYDCTNPASLVEVSRYILDGRPRDVEPAGDYVYVALGPRGVEIIDVSSEAAPVRAYSLAGGEANDLTVAEGVLYTVWNGDLRLYDVSNPAAPAWLSTTPFGGAKFVGVRNRRAFVAERTGVDMGNLVTVNCTNPSTPSVVNVVALGLSSLPGRGEPLAMATRPGLLAVQVTGLFSERRFELYDISSPANPTRESVGLIGDNLPGAPMDFGQSQGINMLYSRDNMESQLFRVQNLSDPTNPIGLIGGLAWIVNCIAANTADAVFTSGPNGLLAFDSDATSGATSAGTTNLGPLEAIATLRTGDSVFCLTEAGITVYDATNPAAPARLGETIPLSVPHNAAMDGNTLYVLNFDELWQYDVTNPAAPVFLGEDDLRDDGHDVDVEGTLACVATDNALDVYRVGDPLSISRRSRVQLTDYPDRVFLRDHTAIVQMESGILFFDLADPNLPVEVALIAPAAGSIRDVAIRDNILFVITSTGRVDAIDFTNPSNPQNRAFLDTGNTGFLSVVDSLVVVLRPSSYEAVIVDWSDPSSPVLLPQTLRTADTIPPKNGVGLDGALFVTTVNNGAETYDLPGHPRVVTQPQQTAACVNSAQVQFSVEVAEPAGTTYRWRKNGTPLLAGTTAWGTTITGVFTSRLTLANPHVQDLAAYDCVITNGCGTTTTQVAALVPGVIPNEVIPPADVQVCTRGEVTLSVGWLGSNPATFQWQAEFPAGSGAWTDLSDGDLSRTFVEGAQTRFLTVGAQAGQTMNDFVQTDYRCIITNTCGSTTSSVGSIRLCIGDYDCSGSPDSDDVIAFFADWDANIGAADVDASGGVDGDDVILFFGRWDAGC
ncbi:MAG: hypothetical protein ACOYN0_13495 [Phycisphaerales bacterium]